MSQEQIESLVIATREIKSEICRSFVWHHWSNSQLDSQQSLRCSWLGIPKSMGFHCRCQRFALHIHGYQKVMLFPLWKQHLVL